MKLRSRDLFATIRTEGGLLPPDLIQKIAAGDGGLKGLTAGDYHLAEGERITEAVNRSWNRLVGAWAGFRTVLARLPVEDAATSPTREKWLLILFQELGYGRLEAARSVEIDGDAYPISHGWRQVPIHLVGARVDLDRRARGVAGAARTSPHGLVQAFLNRSQKHLWGFVSNGLRLRILRDSASLTRQAYVEFDLEAMMEGEVYSDFVVLWLLCHESRVDAEKPSEFWLERWSKAAEEQGTRALDALRDGVQASIESLGRGFLAHPHNAGVRERLRSGALPAQDFYRQLLRVVYRLLFLFVAEDRELIHAPSATPQACERYDRFYSTRRLRRLAERQRGTKHSDLFCGLRLVFDKLDHDDGCVALGLFCLGSFLWSEKAVPDLAHADLANHDLLDAVRALAFTRQDRLLRAVDYKNLGSEELGSVYESLLELRPTLNLEAATFSLEVAAGHERKTTGSYYTPTSLIQCLLDSALQPVLEETARQKKPEQAILGLKVCDPACGSGHFLIAAAHRIGKRLAAVRTGEEEPSPEATRTALRDVIGHCIHGVDLNPMAVELCKVSLWLEALEPGKPLSFLDHRILLGDSLLGTTPALIERGIPDDAFRAIEGDAPEIVNALRKQNREERRGQRSLLVEMAAEPSGLYETLSESVSRLASGDDATIAEIREKEDRLRRLASSPEYQRARLSADAWCAAFVWKKTKSGPSAITEDVFRRLRREPGSVPVAIREEIARLADAYQFFHWHLAFPEVFRVATLGQAENEVAGWSGGFDVVLGNPPWERVKLQQEEWFASVAPAIANAKNAAERKRLIAELPNTDPLLAQSWAAALRRASGESVFLRTSGRYPLGGVGDVNTYAVFADLARQSICATGRAGLIVPNGLVTGFTYRGFLRELLESSTLVSFYGFENEDRIFPEVHNETKFGLLTISGAKGRVDRPWFTAHLRQPEEIKEPGRRYSLSSEQIKAINPNTLNLPAFRWKADAEVSATLHATAPVLVRRYEGDREENPWGLRFRSMFHMANDSGFFLEHQEIAPRTVKRRGLVAVLNDGSEVYPLYEGKMLWHFDHRYGTYEGQTEKQANKGVLPHVDNAKHDDPNYQVRPRYWVDSARVAEALGEDVPREWFFAWRDVGPTERTLVGSFLPVTAAGHKAPFLVSTCDAKSVAALGGLLSSLVVDYDARQKSNGMTFFVVEQVAMLTPQMLAENQPWLGMCARDWIAVRVLELSYTSVDLAPFARAVGHGGPPFRWIPARRATLQAEIDALALHLYGLDRGQAEWLIDSFNVLGRYEQRDHGEFLTKRLVLEAYDALAEAKRVWVAYRTTLDPPPADFRCCHQTPSPDTTKNG